MRSSVPTARRDILFQVQIAVVHDPFGLGTWNPRGNAGAV